MVVIPATDARFGGWTVGPVVGRRPAGVARDAVQASTGVRGVLVVVDARFTDRMPPDADAVARAAGIGAPSVLPLLDAGLLDDGTRWYVTPAAPGPVLDPASGCSPRRAATVIEGVARALAAVHAAGLVHGLVGPQSVVPAAGRHAERPVATTLLLDTGVAALVGDRAADLATAAGVNLPTDRGAAADVHALGALLLRMLTAAAPAGPALAALPVALRALLSEMLDDDPGRRPAAAAVARRLAGMREGLLATGTVDLPHTAAQPAAAQPVAAAAPRTTGPVPVPASLRPAASAAAPPLARVPQPAPTAPAPLRTPMSLDALIDAPDPLPAAAPSLRTGPVAVRSDGRPARRRGRTALLAAGGVGMAGLLVGVLLHLPTGQEAGVVAAAKAGVLGIGPAQSADAQTADAQAPGATPSATARAAAPHAAAPAVAAPAFVRPTRLLPSPLSASATSPTPSRSTPTPTRSSPTPTRSTGGSTPPSSTPPPPESSAPASPVPSAPPAPPAPSAPPETTPPVPTSSPTDSTTTDPAGGPTTDPATSPSATASGPIPQVLTGVR